MAVMDAKSEAAARTLGDVFAKLMWHRHGVHALPMDKPTEVAIQYRSDALGCVRIVICDAAGLGRWLAKNAMTQGGWARFLDVLDKKPEHNKAIQQELPMEMPRVAKQSMLPD